MHGQTVLEPPFVDGFSQMKDGPIKKINGIFGEIWHDGLEVRFFPIYFFINISSIQASFLTDKNMLISN